MVSFLWNLCFDIIVAKTIYVIDNYNRDVR